MVNKVRFGQIVIFPLQKDTLPCPLFQNDADAEWKYARSKLWMSYFEEGGTVPPPLNILPTPKTIWYVLLWFKDKMCRCSKKAKRSKWQSIRVSSAVTVGILLTPSILLTPTCHTTGH